MADRKCTRCEAEKPIDQFRVNRGRRQFVCRECRNAADRIARAEGRRKLDPAKLAIRQARAIAKRKASREWMKPGIRERRCAERRRYRERKAAEQGRVLLAPHGALGRKQEKEAKRAWAWWLKTCPDWWLRAYYRALGKPWNNPRVKPAERWRIRYWCDPAFRAKQIEKVQVLKAKRKQRIEATQDGTLTGAVIVGLFAKAKHCHYCSQPMRSVDKSLDHVVPLSRGGAHSIHNVVVCCKPCNFSKGRNLLPQSVSEQYNVA